MLPDLLPNYSIGPFFGFATNAVMAMLCLAILILYRSYRPLRSLFFFYLFSTFLFLGWVIYGLQRSPESILAGYRMDLAALALLPASWTWFDSALSDENVGGLSRVVTVIGLVLAALALFGKGTWLLGLPLLPHQIDVNILRPQSKLLRPSIHFFSLSVCLLYFLLTVIRFRRPKDQRPSHLLPFGVGMILWFLGGLHDALRSAGVSVPIKGQVFGFTSFWLSVSLSIAVALHFRSLEQAVRESRDVFQKFVPPAYLRRIASKGLGSIRLGEADQQRVTILCCDIVGFTVLSERLPPDQLVALVNQLYQRINRIVDQWQGVIDKFLGDAVLSIFEGEDSAHRAVSCGIGMLQAVKAFNQERDRHLDQEVQIGIGLHTGTVILGTIGSVERMDSTVLGLTVNLAKRLEEATRPLGISMLISEEVANRLPKEHGYQLRLLGRASIKGSSVPIKIVEVFDHDPPELKDLKNRTAPFITEGLRLFDKNELHSALSTFERARTLFPQDTPLRLFESSLRRVLEKKESLKGSALLDFT